MSSLCCSCCVSSCTPIWLESWLFSPWSVCWLWLVVFFICCCWCLIISSNCRVVGSVFIVGFTFISSLLFNNISFSLFNLRCLSCSSLVACSHSKLWDDIACVNFSLYLSYICWRWGSLCCNCLWISCSFCLTWSLTCWLDAALLCTELVTTCFRRRKKAFTYISLYIFFSITLWI